MANMILSMCKNQSKFKYNSFWVSLPHAFIVLHACFLFVITNEQNTEREYKVHSIEMLQKLINLLIILTEIN